MEPKGPKELPEMEEKRIKELIQDVVKRRVSTLKGSHIFHLGEIVELKSIKFIVTNISTHKLTLKSITECTKVERKKNVGTKQKKR